jgi:ligand-binding sensor domain-containing protein/signal transduction histidine kinase
MTPKELFTVIACLAKVFRRLCLLPFLLQIAPVAQIQPYTIKNWDTEDGLPQATPRAILQTRDGYLWVGTFNGLARFDGVQFRSFTVNNIPELKSDQINVLFEDRAGTLWIGTAEGGLIRYRNGIFTAVQPSAHLSINAICEDGTGRILIAASDGIYQVSNGELLRHQIAGLPQSEIIALMPGLKDNELWIGTRRSLHRTRAGKVIGNPIDFQHEVHTMELDELGRPWISFSNVGLGFAEIPPQDDLAVPASADQNEVPYHSGLRFTLLPNRFKASAMHLSTHRRLWLGAHTGPLLQLKSGQTNSLLNLARPAPHPVCAIFEDRDEHLWVGMEGRGLFQLRRNLIQNLGTEQGLLTAVISSICEDRQGTIWVGTFGKGLHRWNPIEHRFDSVRPDLLNITSLAADKDGTLWLGRFGGPLSLRNMVGTFDSPENFGMRTRVLFNDRDGSLWIGTMENGLEHVIDGVVTRFTMREGLASDHIRAIAQDTSGDIWIGSSRGLNRLQQGHIQHFERDDGLGGNEIRALFLDSEGTLWIGSTGGGLTRWRDRTFRSIGIREGLINDWIEQILEDQEGNLWLGSNGGLMRVSLKELNDCASGRIPLVHCSYFGRSDGLLLPHCGTGFQPSALRASNGDLWFGTDAGIVVIDPKQIKSKTEPPEVYIEELHVDNRIHPVRSDASESKLLPAGTQRLEFHFTAIDFSQPSKIRFRYKLEGLDSEWSNAALDREAIYNHLPPGEYTFRVMAANNHGFWNEAGASLSLTIAPFFWQTRLFQALAAAAALAGTGLVTRTLLVRKHRRELLSLAQRHALEQERARIARDIHDGVGASLVKISLLGDFALRQSSTPSHAEDPVRKMTSTARQVLRDMDEIVWAVDPKNDTLENFANYLCHFANEHFQDTQIACRLNIPSEFPVVSLSANTRHNLLLATQEALNNVLKHSSATRAHVSLELQGSSLVVEIADNGSCPNKTPFRQGNGIRNIQERLFQIGGSAAFDQIPGGGTRVRLTVRINESF